MSRYFDDFTIENDELIHYGVKGMKWRQRKAVEVSKRTTYANRPRARRRFVTEGNGDGVWRADEKVAGYHGTKPKDQATSGLSMNDRLSILQRNAKMQAENKKKKASARKRALAMIKATRI